MFPNQSYGIKAEDFRKYLPKDLIDAVFTCDASKQTNLLTELRKLISENKNMPVLIGEETFELQHCDFFLRSDFDFEGISYKKSNPDLMMATFGIDLNGEGVKAAYVCIDGAPIELQLWTELTEMIQALGLFYVLINKAAHTYKLISTVGEAYVLSGDLVIPWFYSEFMINPELNDGNWYAVLSTDPEYNKQAKILIATKDAEDHIQLDTTAKALADLPRGSNVIQVAKIIRTDRIRNIPDEELCEGALIIIELNGSVVHKSVWINGHPRPILDFTSGVVLETEATTV